MDKKKIEEEIKINRFKLEEECEIQPSLYFEYSRRLSEMKSKRDKLNEGISYRSAVIELEFRTDPYRFISSDVKVTEGVVKSFLESNLELKRMRSELMEVLEELNELDSVCRSLEHRKSMLNDLVTLYLNNYYSDPSGRYSKVDEIQSGVREKLNKKKEE